MPFHGKRMFLERMSQERPRKLARVQSTASLSIVNNKEPFRPVDELFDRCWARAFSNFDEISDTCWDNCWARAFSKFDEIFDKCWDKCLARAFSNCDENFDKCWDRCWARAFSKLASNQNLDLLQEELTDAPHQDDLTISQYSRRQEKGAEVMTDLPEDIVVKIIAMAPFPSIFKAVGLSKAWRARFLPSYKSPEVMDLSKSSTSDSYRLENGENERCLTTSFQKQVIGEWSKDWETFHPIFIAEDHFVTYGQKSRNWRRISLSFLPEILHRTRIGGRSLDMDALQIEGALLYISHCDSRKHMYVADILTQRWKKLPRSPKTGKVVCSKVVSNTSLGTYKVIVFSSDNNYDCYLSGHIYDSISGTWSTERFSVTFDFFDKLVTGDKDSASASASAAYLNGVLYMMDRTLRYLLAFNLAERTLEELELSFNGKSRDWVMLGWDCSISLLVYNDNRLVVTKLNRWEDVQILELDLNSLQLIPLCSGPPPSVCRVRRIDPRPVSTGGNCIFFKTRGRGRGRGKMLEYNVTEDAWTSFPIPSLAAPFDYTSRYIYHFIPSSFQPSLSAFVSL